MILSAVANAMYIKASTYLLTELDTLRRSTYIVGFYRSLMAQTEFKSYLERGIFGLLKRIV